MFFCYSLVLGTFSDILNHHVILYLNPPIVMPILNHKDYVLLSLVLVIVSLFFQNMVSLGIPDCP